MDCLTITLNAAVDETYVVDRFHRGEAHRLVRKHTMPGGKGNNVARVLAGFGHAVTATGFLAGHTGEFIETGLRDAGIYPQFTWLESGESRTCHTILETDSGVASELLEAGPCVSETDMNGFLEALPRLVEEVDVVVVSGSALPGVTPAFLEELTSIVRRGSPALAIDSSGQTLQTLLSGKPDIVKPNMVELEQLMGRSASTEAHVAFVQTELLPNRMAPKGRVLLSNGRKGALLISRDNVLAANAPSIDAVNTVGCGDALLAGFLDGLLTGVSQVECLRNAVAAGSAAAPQETAGRVDADDFERLRTIVDVTEHRSEQRWSDSQ